MKDFKGKVGLPSLPVFCGQGSSLFPPGSEPQSGGSHQMNVTGLMLCFEKQKTSPQARMEVWGGQDGACEPHSQGTQHLPLPATQALAVLGKCLLLGGGPDSEQPVCGDKETSRPGPPSFSSFSELQRLPFLPPAGTATVGC